METERILTDPCELLCVFPHTFPVLVVFVDSGDNMQQVEEKPSNLLFCSNASQSPFCFLAKPFPAQTFSLLHLSFSVNK